MACSQRRVVWMRWVGSVVAIMGPPMVWGQSVSPGNSGAGPTPPTGGSEPAGSTPATWQAWRERYPGLEVYMGEGTAQAVFGRPMTTAPTPPQAADAWLAEFREALGVSGLELRLQRRQPLRFGGLTVFAYQQLMEGLPVENGIARLVVWNGPPARAIYFGSQLAPPPAAGFRADTVDADTALTSVRRMASYSELTDWSVPRLVVFYGGDERGGDTVRAWKFTASRFGTGRPEVYTFFVEASDGRLVHVRDEVYEDDITGHVHGNATPGTLPDMSYNQPVEMSMADVRVLIADTVEVFTDASGAYVLPYAGTGPVTVESGLLGHWVWVIDYWTNDVLHLSETVTPPAVVDFLFNATPWARTTSQVNAFMRATQTYDFYKARQPQFEGLDLAVIGFVNYPEICNALYTQVEGYHVLVFFDAGGPCPNTAYSSVITHEYGHFIVNQLFLAQGAFGEGFADSLALVLYDDPVMGRDFFGPDSYIRHIEEANKQYPCVGEIHDCGQVLAGCWWDLRRELDASLGDPAALEITQQLFTDWSQITIGGQGMDSAHLQTLIEVLTADDDDGDLGTGTPHDCQIVRAFRAHGIDTLAVLTDCDNNGVPDVCQGMPDCNTNGIRDLCDVSLWGTSKDCNGNGIPDECDLASRDCNANGIPDDCDVSAGSSPDCNGNHTPDECDVALKDCNGNDRPDDCDILAGTSLDCNANHTPDECDVALKDCNGNDRPDDCDIYWGTSADCTHNDVPDECDIATGVESDCNVNGTPDHCDLDTRRSYDCNTNAVPDECDIAAEFSGDCNANVIPDECDVVLCHALWDGFQANPPFSFQRPLAEIDYNGDGIFWDNPAHTATIFAPGCETGTPFDQAVKVIVPTGAPPESGYVASEYLYTHGGALDSGALTYRLRFKAKVAQSLNPKTDWQFFVLDAARGSKVLEIDFTSTVSTRVPAAQRGKILVKDPIPGGNYLSTGVTLALNACHDLEIVLDNATHTVQLFIDGVPRLDPPLSPLQGSAARMDYFLLQAVANGAPSGGTAVFFLDAFEPVCIRGGEKVPAAVYDCNANGTHDECDLAAGTSPDCQLNGIPDECDVAAQTSADVNGNGIPDECEGVQLIATVPPDQSSLWRTARNTIRLSFDGDITAPTVGQLTVRRMLEGGGFGPDLSAHFTLAVHSDAQGRPRVLKLVETTPCLTHGTWVALRNLGASAGWTGVSPFVVEYVVQVGDVNNDAQVSAADLSAIFPKIPTAGAGDQERTDVNGDGKVLATDLSAVFPRIPSPPVPKPSGH